MIPDFMRHRCTYYALKALNPFRGECCEELLKTIVEPYLSYENSHDET